MAQPPSTPAKAQETGDPVRLVLHEPGVGAQQLSSTGEVRSSLFVPAEVQQALTDLLVAEAALGLSRRRSLRSEALLDGQRLGGAAERSDAARDAPLGDASLLRLA